MLRHESMEKGQFLYICKFFSPIHVKSWVAMKTHYISNSGNCVNKATI